MIKIMMRPRDGVFFAIVAGHVEGTARSCDDAPLDARYPCRFRFLVGAGDVTLTIESREALEDHLQRLVIEKLTRELRDAESSSAALAWAAARAREDLDRATEMLREANSSGPPRVLHPTEPMDGRPFWESDE